ncbi:MAG: hypothetical protein ACREJU_15025 [Nitrospiraceae bacterium]
MFAQDEQRKSLGWLTFTMHTIRLDASQVVHANGQLIDGNDYDLDVKIQRVDPEAATLLYVGRVGTHSFPPQEARLPLVPGQPIELHLTGIEDRNVTPPLYAAWEESVQVLPGETAVLMIGQRSEDDADPRPSKLSLMLISFLSDVAFRV